MQSFKDTTGRTWEVAINVAQVKRVRGLTGVDLYKLIEDKLRPLADLLGDPCKLVDVIYVLCKEQADKAGVSDEQFGEAFGGDVLEAAGLAFVEALTDFFPNPQARKSLRDVMGKGREVGRKLLTHAEKMIDELDPEKTASTLIDSWTKRPASVASTPDPSP